MTLRTTGPIFGLMSVRTINLSDQWPFGLLTIRTNGMIFGPMTLRTTDLSDYWPFGLVHDFRTNEPSDQRPFGISSCPPLTLYVWCLLPIWLRQFSCEPSVLCDWPWSRGLSPWWCLWRASESHTRCKPTYPPGRLRAGIHPTDLNKIKT